MHSCTITISSQPLLFLRLPLHSWIHIEFIAYIVKPYNGQWQLWCLEFSYGLHIVCRPSNSSLMWECLRIFSYTLFWLNYATNNIQAAVCDHTVLRSVHMVTTKRAIAPPLFHKQTSETSTDRTSHSSTESRNELAKAWGKPNTSLFRWGKYLAKAKLPITNQLF